jgi:hypothetical protein
MTDRIAELEKELALAKLQAAIPIRMRLSTWRAIRKQAMTWAAENKPGKPIDVRPLWEGLFDRVRRGLKGNEGFAVISGFKVKCWHAEEGRCEACEAHNHVEIEYKTYPKDWKGGE